jgi:hypothetical protein
MKDVDKKCVLWLWLLCLATGVFTVACKDSAGVEDATPHDPSKPVVLSDFTPKRGYISSQVILEGENFGNNAGDVSVWFNDKPAAVLSAKGNRMLVLAPRRPGEMCTIKVKIGDFEASYKEQFDYVIQTTISTLVGGTQATTNPIGTVSLANAQFNRKFEANLAIDSENNIFTVVPQDNADHQIFIINEEEDKVRMAGTLGYNFIPLWLVGYNPLDDNVYIMASNSGVNEYRYLDKSIDFANISAGNVTWDSSIAISGGLAIFGARRAFEMRPSDGMFYTRTGEGVLARFDPVTATGENLNPSFIPSGGDTHGIVFDRRDDNIMYFTSTGRHCIFRYDIAKQDLSVLAGVDGQAGYLDGQMKNAKFNAPCQMCIDSENNLYVTDRENHCIRRISLSSGYVSTAAGLPGQPGYADGSAEVARFNKPLGLCITSEDIMYVGDQENYAIRRVAIE